MRLLALLRRLENLFQRQYPSRPETPSLAPLQEALGYHFTDQNLLREALVHRSYLPQAREEPARVSNERLEFLGDAVLSLVVNNYLYQRYPDKSEGELTKMKSVIVSKPILFHYAKKCNLGSFILMSENAHRAGVDEAENVLADTLEAVFGAVFLDGGFAAASRCIRELMLSDLKEIVYNEENVNYKSLLQEYIQALHKIPPRYRVCSTSGPDHDKEFSVEVSVRGNVLGRGRGRTKKLAEQEAAREAYRKLLNAEEIPGGPSGDGKRHD